METNNKDTSIDKQVNIKNANGVNIGPQIEEVNKLIKTVGNEIRKEDKALTDPTLPYSISDKTIKVKTFDGLKEQVIALKEERIILLNSFDQTLLDAATYAIISKLQKQEALDCRVLEFKDSNLNRTDLDLTLFTNQQIGKGNSQIVVVHLTNVKPAESFFDSLFGRLNSGDVIKSQLASNKIFVLVTFSSTTLMQKFRERKSQFYFLHWYISFTKYLSPLLKDIFSQEETDYLYEKIIEQHKYGLFGDNEEEFYQKISKKIEEGKRALRDEIGRNIERVATQKKNGQQQIKRLGAEELLKTCPISKELLYVAAFFPQLGFREFNKIASFILKGKKKEIEIEEKYTTKKGKKKTRTVTQTIIILDHFNQNRDEAYQKTYLEEVKTEDLTTVIDFQEPYLRKEVKVYYLKNFPDYTKQQFQDIIQFDLLFDIDASNQLIDNIVKLVVETALTNPNYYGRELLMKIGLGKFVKQEESDTEEEKKDIIIQALNVFLEGIEQYHNLNRLASLIGEMLEYPQLKKSIDHFFGDLIQTWQKPEIVLEILKRLRFSKHLDQLFWLKRIFNEISPDQKYIKQSAYNYLIRLGRQNSFNIYNFLAQIKEWQPHRKTKYNIKKDKLHKLYSLSFLYSYSVAVVHTLPEKLYGEFPSKYFLFAKFAELSDQEIKDKIRFLVVWLFHEHLNGLFYNNKPSFDVNDINTNADLIEHWSLILLGNSKKQQAVTHEHSKILLKMIFVSIKQNTDKLTQRNLRVTWFEKRRYYLNYEASLPTYEKDKRKKARFRRKHLDKLIKHFDKAK